MEPPTITSWLKRMEPMIVPEPVLLSTATKVPMKEANSSGVLAPTAMRMEPATEGGIR